MGAKPQVRDLQQFLAERGEHLLRAAILLTGDRGSGEDLLQAGLERLIKAWDRIDGDPEGYLRRTVYHLAADGWRRKRLWQRRAPLLYASGRHDVTADETAGLDLRDALVRLVAQLPARQRAVIVLRYWEQLSEAETAEVLGCSVGNIKSSTSRALARLRELSSALAAADPEPAGERNL